MSSNHRALLAWTLWMLIGCGEDFRAPDAGADATADAMPQDALPDVAGCDLGADPKDSPKCLDDALGVITCTSRSGRAARS